jgi:hypothetical protein
MFGSDGTACGALPYIIPLPFRHIKATMRTVRPGKERAFSHKKTREILWQAVSGHLHLWPHIGPNLAKGDFLAN